ncbi:MAG: hypothetical protein Q4P29_03925 [Tissierellia bacterium]|nr:hypothetical protein [Tissierellia bacterium]
MYCYKCGSKLNKNANFCHTCGAKINENIEVLFVDKTKNDNENTGTIVNFNNLKTKISKVLLDSRDEEESSGKFLKQRPEKDKTEEKPIEGPIDGAVEKDIPIYIKDEFPKERDYKLNLKKPSFIEKFLNKNAKPEIENIDTLDGDTEIATEFSSFKESENTNNLDESTISKKQKELSIDESIDKHSEKPSLMDRIKTFFREDDEDEFDIFTGDNYINETLDEDVTIHEDEDEIIVEFDDQNEDKADELEYKNFEKSSSYKDDKIEESKEIIETKADNKTEDSIDKIEDHSQRTIKFSKKVIEANIDDKKLKEESEIEKSDSGEIKTTDAEFLETDDTKDKGLFASIKEFLNSKTDEEFILEDQIEEIVTEDKDSNLDENSFEPTIDQMDDKYTENDLFSDSHKYYNDYSKRDSTDLDEDKKSFNIGEKVSAIILSIKTFFKSIVSFFKAPKKSKPVEQSPEKFSENIEIILNDPSYSTGDTMPLVLDEKSKELLNTELEKRRKESMPKENILDKLNHIVYPIIKNMLAMKFMIRIPLIIISLVLLYIPVKSHIEMKWAVILFTILKFVLYMIQSSVPMNVAFTRARIRLKQSVINFFILLSVTFYSIISFVNFKLTTPLETTTDLLLHALTPQLLVNIISGVFIMALILIIAYNHIKKSNSLIFVGWFLVTQISIILLIKLLFILISTFLGTIFIHI